MHDGGDIDRLLHIVGKYDCCDSIFWDEHLHFYVICNDFFAWASADLEIILEDEINRVDDLVKAFEDAGVDGPLLFCARVKKMRPQGAAYKYLNKENWQHFNNCGPKRKVGFGNPGTQPSAWDGSLTQVDTGIASGDVEP